MSDTVVAIPRRALVLGATALAILALLVLLVVIPGPREALARGLAPVTTADPATLLQQRTAAEHSIQRGYVKATAQLKQVRELTLAIPKSEADQIDQKAGADLASIRRQALTAVGSGSRVPAAQFEQYVTGAERTLDAGNFENESGVLLAPALFDIVRRADDLFQQIADEATREMTRAPGTLSPTARPPATRSASPSPSPTRP